jgi:hypothetical protein
MTEQRPNNSFHEIAVYPIITSFPALTLIILLTLLHALYSILSVQWLRLIAYLPHVSILVIKLRSGNSAKSYFGSIVAFMQSGFPDVSDIRKVSHSATVVCFGLCNSNYALNVDLPVLMHLITPRYSNQSVFHPESIYQSDDRFPFVVNRLNLLIRGACFVRTNLMSGLFLNLLCES